jgi:hypothetical protein
MNDTTNDPNADPEMNKILETLHASEAVDISSVLTNLKIEMDKEIGEATGGFKEAAKELKDQVLQLGEMAKEAGANTAEVKAKTAALKQDLDTFEKKFGKLGERFGTVVKGGLNKMLPPPL